MNFFKVITQDFSSCVCFWLQFNMEQRRREQEHHEKHQELQQLMHKDRSQQSESVHTHTHTLSKAFTLMTCFCKFKLRFQAAVLHLIFKNKHFSEC